MKSLIVIVGLLAVAFIISGCELLPDAVRGAAADECIGVPVPKTGS